MKSKLAILIFFLLIRNFSEAQYHKNFIPYLKSTYLKDSTRRGYHSVEIFGYADSTKKIIIPPQFKRVSRFKNGTAFVTNYQDRKDIVAMIDTNGNFLIPFGRYDHIDFINQDGFAIVSKNKKYGLIDRRFKEVIPLVYEALGEIKNGILPAQLNGKWGFIDMNQKVIIDFKYDNIKPFQHGLAKVTNGTFLKGDEKDFFINSKGEEIHTKEEYDEMGHRFSDGLMIVENRGIGNQQEMIRRYGYIDTLAQTVIPLQYEDASSFSNGIARVKKEGKWGVINTKGNTVVPFKYDYLDSFHEGLAAVKIDGRIGFMDEKYKVVIKPVYEDFRSFNEGVAAVRFNGNWGFINKKGEIVVPIEYEEVSEFHEGYAAVKKHLDEFTGDWGYVDKSGKIVIPIQFYFAGDFESGYAEINHSSTYINKKGEEFAAYEE